MEDNSVPSSCGAKYRFCPRDLDLPRSTSLGEDNLVAGLLRDSQVVDPLDIAPKSPDHLVLD
jgi:hypothetical protein